MKKFVLLALLIQGTLILSAQNKSNTPDVSKGDNTYIGLEGDTITYRDKASYELKRLKKGSVIVRLKTNPKSVDAYRKAGREDIAKQIEDNRKEENLKIYSAFKKSFTFCKTFFIYSSDTRKFLDGDRSVFLNEDLEYDLSIAFTDTDFVFCEYGSAESFSKFTDQSGRAVPKPTTEGGAYEGAGGNKIMDTVTRRTTTDPASGSVLFFSDKTLEQLHRPFPMSDAIYFNNFSGAVASLSRQMERSYYNLVTMRQYKDKQKAQRKKDREKEREALRNKKL